MKEVHVEFPHLSNLPPTLADSVQGTPDRRPGSVRRSSTIDMGWPDGFGTPLQLLGRARDLLTPREGDPSVVDEASIRVRLDDSRTVRSIETTPQRRGVRDLIGAAGGAELRGAIDRALPGERESATPLHLLLDDIAGTSLIAGFAWSRSRPDARRRMRRGPPDFGKRKGRIICSGLRPDGWADTHRRHDKEFLPAIVPAGNIRTPDDPLGWHAFPPDPEVGMRRHRRIDVWRRDDVLVVDAFFRDVCWDPDGSQHALHEYTVSGGCCRIRSVSGRHPMRDSSKGCPSAASGPASRPH
jgi:hypothetical protein